TNIVLSQSNCLWLDPLPAPQQRFYRLVSGPIPIGDSAWETTPVGAVISDNFDRAALGSNWIVLSDTGVGISSNELLFSQSDISYARQVYYQPWQTCSDTWTIRWKQRFGALNGNSRGVGVGIKNFQTFGGNDRGYNGLFCGSGTDLGKMQILRFDGSTQ